MKNIKNKIIKSFKKTIKSTIRTIKDNAFLTISTVLSVPFLLSLLYNADFLSIIKSSAYALFFPFLFLFLSQFVFQNTKTIFRFLKFKINSRKIFSNKKLSEKQKLSQEIKENIKDFKLKTSKKEKVTL